MPEPARGEVWQVDLGMIAKVRPAVVISRPPSSSDRALYAVIPHTTSVRGTAYEVTIPVFGLEEGCFDVQNLAIIPRAKLLRKRGVLTSVQGKAIEEKIKLFFALT